MEQPMVTAVTHAYEARVTLTGLRDEPGVAGSVFGALADANVNVDMIIQNEPVSDDSKADLSFTVARDDLTKATEALAGIDVAERWTRTTRSARSRSSAPGCAATRASPRPSSGSSARPRSTSR